MNHLEEAKNNMREVVDIVGVNSTELDFIVAHALISIAESLEKIANECEHDWHSTSDGKYCPKCKITQHPDSLADELFREDK